MSHVEERRKKLAHMFNNLAPIAKTLGLRLTYHGEVVHIEMPYDPKFDTAGGNVHGGIGAVLLDTAMARAYFSIIMQLKRAFRSDHPFYQWFAAAPFAESWILTATLNVTYMRPTVKTALRAEGKLIRAGKSQLVAEGYIYDAQGNACSHATATFLTTPATVKEIGFPTASKL